VECRDLSYQGWCGKTPKKQSTQLLQTMRHLIICSKFSKEFLFKISMTFSTRILRADSVCGLITILILVLHWSFLTQKAFPREQPFNKNNKSIASNTREVSRTVRRVWGGAVRFSNDGSKQEIFSYCIILWQISMSLNMSPRYTPGTVSIIL